MRSNENLISVNELRANLQQPHWRVVDCRFSLQDPSLGRQQYENGHIPGAHYADLDRDLAGPVTASSGRHPLPDPIDFARTLGRWGITNRSQVVAYDDAGGAIAARLWWLCKWCGHQQVAVLDGGIQAWARSNELATDRPSAAETIFDVNPDSNKVVSTPDVERMLAGNAGFCLVDARDPARFGGEQEPIDAVAGHIPGALNYPFSHNLDESGKWLSPARLRERWAAVPGAGGDEPWAVMCGSGVTACHLALAAECAGLSAPALYVGSWSEWIREPSRPVARGAT
ncbi:MAG: sulfurtransferase [Gammaproteobacteria bacterium]|nr:sulfurtransferase [Gammaproteobacteria bacterium]